jgi:hypothetical protein
MKRFIPTRWSHLLGFSGVGALVRADNDLFVVMDISYWTDKSGQPAGEPLCYVDLLRGALQLDNKELLQPPLARLINNGVVDGTCVPAVRFPRWTRCPSCGLLHYLPWRTEGQEQSSREDPRCRCNKRSRLRQVDWVVAHPDGGLWDVPWHWLAHQHGQAAADCRNNNLQASIRLTRGGETGHWRLHCERCNTPPQRFNPNQTFKDGQHARLQPWQSRPMSQVVPSKQPARILEVNDPRLYFTRLRSGLVIPPESQVERGGVLDRLYRNHAARRDLARSRAPGPLLRRLANDLGCTKNAVQDALEQIEAGWPLYGQETSPGQLLEKEYRALITVIPDQLEGEDFVTEHQSAAWQSLPLDQADASRVRAAHDTVHQLVAVTRLREIRVFTGFNRVEQYFDDGIKPDTGGDTEGDTEAPKARLVPPDLDGHLDWLPAIELYGEGIFFTLNEALLQRWEVQEGVLRRAEALQQRFERTGMRFPDDPPLPLSPRFMLLHTLAHLLIRQLEAEAGYSSASIRERIYCAPGPEPMAGILIYVAVTDVSGSLGGLAELAEPKRFLQLLTSVFDHADWCSLDPVCAEHEGQGPSQINRAACHACALVPEPSCQFGNVLLDRVFVVGDLGGEIQSLLAFAARD